MTRRSQHGLWGLWAWNHVWPVQEPFKMRWLVNEERAVAFVYPDFSQVFLHKLMKFKLGMWVLRQTENQLNCWVQRTVIGDTKSCQRPGPSAVPQGFYWVQYCKNFINELNDGRECILSKLAKWGWGFDARAEGDLKRWRNGMAGISPSSAKRSAKLCPLGGIMVWTTLGSSQLERALQRRTWGSWGHLADHKPAVYPCGIDGQPPPRLH